MLINFQVWVPVGALERQACNHRQRWLQPLLNFGDMAYAMRQGYAVIGGDTGHQWVDPNDLSWGMGHPEKIIDWGTRSINAITAPGKRIVTELQGRGASVLLLRLLNRRSSRLRGDAALPAGLRRHDQWCAGQ